MEKKATMILTYGRKELQNFKRAKTTAFVHIAIYHKQ